MLRREGGRREVEAGLGEGDSQRKRDDYERGHGVPYPVGECLP